MDYPSEKRVYTYIYIYILYLYLSIYLSICMCLLLNQQQTTHGDAESTIEIYTKRLQPVLDTRKVSLGDC